MNIQEFDNAITLTRALLWQDNAAANLTSLIKQKQAWYTQNWSQFWDDFYTDIFDLRTCNQFGMSVWAIILGMPLSIIVPPSDHPNTFGFDGQNTVIERTYDASDWTLVGGGSGVTITPNQPDSDGGTNAVLYDFTSAAGSNGIRIKLDSVMTGTVTSGLMAMVETVDPSGLQASVGGGTAVAYPSLTVGTWQPVDMTYAAGSSGAYWDIVVAAALSGFKINLYKPRIVEGSLLRTGYKNFNNGNFGNRNGSEISNLTLDQKRQILQLRYYQLVMRPTVPNINMVLRNVFGGGYVTDNHDMTITYTIPSLTNSQMITAIQQFDLLPRPAGVSITGV